MKRALMLSFALAAILATTAFARTSIQVNIGLAPPPPAIVFHRPPPMVFVPEQQVYVVGGPDFAYDCFRFGAYFYLYNEGWWYRARRYGGPYRVVEARYVPRPIWFVPQARWRHHPHGMPPGLAKKHSGHDRGWADDRGRGNGRGNGRGHDRH